MMNRRRGPVPVDPDIANDNPFRGLPHDFPEWHSRFPPTPSQGYGDLSFDPAVVQNSRTGGLTLGVTSEQEKAWRDAMTRALGEIMPKVTKDEKGD